MDKNDDYRHLIALYIVVHAEICTAYRVWLALSFASKCRRVPSRTQKCWRHQKLLRHYYVIGSNFSRTKSQKSKFPDLVTLKPPFDLLKRGCIKKCIFGLFSIWLYLAILVCIQFNLVSTYVTLLQCSSDSDRRRDRKRNVIFFRFD